MKLVKNVLVKKVRCELCIKELNKTYLRSHIKEQHMQHIIQQHYNQQFYNQYIEKKQHNNGASEAASEGLSNGASENNRTKKLVYHFVVRLIC